jgi:hypothetical protein
LGLHFVARAFSHHHDGTDGRRLVADRRHGHRTSARTFEHAAEHHTFYSRHGFWLLSDDEALCVRFDELAWCVQSTVEALTPRLEWSNPDHLYWPLRDVDRSVRSI